MKNTEGGRERERGREGDHTWPSNMAVAAGTTRGRSERGDGGAGGALARRRRRRGRESSPSSSSAAGRRHGPPGPSGRVRVSAGYGSGEAGGGERGGEEDDGGGGREGSGGRDGTGEFAAVVGFLFGSVRVGSKSRAARLRRTCATIRTHAWSNRWRAGEEKGEVVYASARCGATFCGTHGGGALPSCILSLGSLRVVCWHFTKGAKDLGEH
jgi:hypothetical protein